MRALDYGYPKKAQPGMLRRPPPRRPPTPSPAPPAPKPLPAVGVLLTQSDPLGPNEALLAGSPLAGATQYAFTLVPSNGGKPVKFSSASPGGIVQGLMAGVTYNVTLIAKDKNGNALQSPTQLSFKTPLNSMPLLVAATPETPSALEVEGTPPKSGGPWKKFTYTAKNARTGKSVTVTCTTPACPIPGLTPGAKYTVGMTVTDSKGKTVPAPNTKEVIMPDGNSAVITVATPKTPTVATLKAKKTDNAVSYTFYIRPFGAYTVSRCKALLLG